MEKQTGLCECGCGAFAPIAHSTKKNGAGLKAIPKDLRNAYDRYHDLTLIIEREFVEAAGSNWQEHDRLIEDSRGKIPIGGSKPLLKGGKPLLDPKLPT